jgi:hypothetical protein
MRRVLRISVWLAIVAVIAFILMLGSSIYTFHALTAETLIAELEFDRAGEQRFLAHLRTGDFCAAQSYEILGEQWRIDAQFLKWKSWATLLGLDSQYRLERLEGRYRDAAEQNSLPTLAHALAPPAAIDIGGLSGSLGRFNFLADASYGSSTYHDIDTASRYLVLKSPTGIFTRTEPRGSTIGAVNEFTADGLHDCSGGPGLVTKGAEFINRTVDRDG